MVSRFIFVLLFYFWRVFCLHICLHHVLMEAQKEHEVPRLGITGGCELPLGAGNRICKRSQVAAQLQPTVKGFSEKQVRAMCGSSPSQEAC